MAQNISAVGGREDVSTRTLLLAGAAAGPLFIAVGFLQAFTRPGFDPVRHPLSLLSLGEGGWIQIANFVVAGLLYIASASGMRRVMAPGVGGRWAPLLMTVFGISLIAGGVFVADPALGFPPGAPEGRPNQLSWHGLLHAFAPAIGFNALIAASFVFARRLALHHDRPWAVYSALTGAAVLVLSVWSSASMNFVALWVAMVLGFSWASAAAARLLRRLA